jgi:MoaA/NifB/PqqE/SkfB family radical SAM enzyme
MQKSSSRPLSGRKSWYPRQYMYYCIGRQAFRLFRNPLEAVSGLHTLLEFQKSVNGTPVISKFVKNDTLYFWTPEYPGFPSEKFNTLIHSEFYLSGRKKNDVSPIPLLKTVVWAITNRCPFSCSHCYEWENIDKSDSLNPEELRKILTVFKNNHIKHIQFSGGEPLVRFDDLAELIRDASGTMDCWLLTSGFGLTQEKSNRLKASGLTGVHISLDHWDEEQNNLFRNHPLAFKSAITAVRNSLNAGLLVSLSLCATRRFASEENLLNYAEMARDLGVHFIRVLEPRATGKLANLKVHLDWQQIKMISEFAIKMNSDPRFADFPIIEFLGYHQQKMPCFGAGNRFLYVDPNGDVHACPFCRGITGNILNEPFLGILDKTQIKGCPYQKAWPMEYGSLSMRRGLQRADKLRLSD